MNKITNLPQLEGEITNTYLFAILASSMIAFEGGKNPQDAKKRRIWFIVIGILATVGFFCYNFFVVSGKIVPVPMLQDKFMMCCAISTVVVLLVYFALGFALSKILKKSKFGTIFSKNQR